MAASRFLSGRRPDRMAAWAIIHEEKVEW